MHSLARWVGRGIVAFSRISFNSSTKLGECSGAEMRRCLRFGVSFATVPRI